MPGSLEHELLASRIDVASVLGTTSEIESCPTSPRYFSLAFSLVKRSIRVYPTYLQLMFYSDSYGEYLTLTLILFFYIDFSFFSNEVRTIDNTDDA